MNVLKSIFKGVSGSNMTSLSAAEASQLLKGNRPPFIVDVRQPSEYQAGHIAGSTLIPLDELARRTAEIPTDREILCVCQSGMRSSVAARQLASAGYTVINLSGGLSAWSQAGLPVKRGK